MHIDVVSWDDPHAPAPMDARFTPQEAVNRGLPTPAACDLTVVLLWGRMGTPLAETKADGTPYLSGTEWEFENALNAGKAVLVYRRSEKVLLDADDPEHDEKLEQRRRVNSFFERFKGEGGTLRRSYTTYGSAVELIERMRQDVEVDLLGLRLKKDHIPSLSTIYVPQTTRARLDRGDVLAGGKDRARAEWTSGHLQRDPHALVLDRLATESLYVSGAPGTGKSIFCRWVAWLVAEGAMPAFDVAPPEEFLETLERAIWRLTMPSSQVRQRSFVTRRRRFARRCGAKCSTTCASGWPFAVACSRRRSSSRCCRGRTAASVRRGALA